MLNTDTVEPVDVKDVDDAFETAALAYDGGWVPTTIPPPPTQQPKEVRIPPMSHFNALREKYPNLAEELIPAYNANALPSLEAGHIDAIDYDIRSAYYGLNNKPTILQAISGSPWLEKLKELPKPVLAAYHEVLRDKFPRIGNLHVITGEPAIERKWIRDLAVRSWRSAAVIYEDLRHYISLASAARKFAVSFKRVSQYPFETQSWSDVIDDYNFLRRRFQLLHIEGGATQHKDYNLPPADELWHSQTGETHYGETNAAKRFGVQPKFTRPTKFVPKRERRRR